MERSRKKSQSREEKARKKSENRRSSTDDLFENDPLEHLKQKYRDLGSNVAFLSASALRRLYRGKLTGKQIDEFLATSQSYTLGRCEKQRKVFGRTIAYHRYNLKHVVVACRMLINLFDFRFDKYQCDLVDISRLSDYNLGFRYILVVIDCFSRYLWCELLKTKSCDEMVIALEKIFLRGASPNILSSDEGAEFKCKKVAALLKQYKVRQFFAESDFKAAVCERVNLSLQRHLYRAMLGKETYKHYDMLQHIVRSYNERYHSSLGMSPASAHLPHNSGKIARVRAKRVANGRVKKIASKYRENDRVRLSFKKTAFSRGYGQFWTDKIFIIDKVNTDNIIPFYRLRNERNRNGDELPVKGKFYASQLQLTNIDKYRASATGRERTRRGKKQVELSWKGYDSTFDSFVEADKIEKIGAEDNEEE